MTQPKKIKRTDKESLQITWSEENVTEISLTDLRDNCPCVHCKGETVIFSSYIPIKAPFKAAGFYEIEKIEPIGNYAIQIIWKDKHNTGIYSWDYLKEISSSRES